MLVVGSSEGYGDDLRQLLDIDICCADEDCQADDSEDAMFFGGRPVLNVVNVSHAGTASYQRYIPEGRSDQCLAA